MTTVPYRHARYSPRPLPKGKLDPAIEAWLAQEFKNVYAGIPYTSVIDIRDFTNGGGGNDDTADWKNAINQAPDHAKIIMPAGFQTSVTNLSILNRTDLTIEAPHNPRDTYFGKQYPAAQILGIGSGNLIDIVNSGHCTLRGIAIEGGTNPVALNIDQIDATKTRICTENHFEFLRIVGPVGNRTWKAVSIATSADTQADSTKDGWNNCEYMRFFCCSLTPNQDSDPVFNSGNVANSRIFGPPFGFGAGGSMSAGNNLLTDTNSNPFTAGMVGLRLRGPWGSGNTLLDTTIASFVDSGHVHLTAPAVAAASNVCYIVDENYGTLFYVARSFNAKRHTLWLCNLSKSNIAINSNGGSIHLYDANLTGNDLNINIQNNQSESSFEIGTNSENSRQHLNFGNSMTHGWSIRGGSRFAVGDCNPGYSYIHLGAGFPCLTMDDSVSFENQLPFGSVVLNLSRFESAGSTVRSGGTIWDTNITDATAGVDNIQQNSVYWTEFDVPGGTTLGGFQVRGDPNNAIKFQWRYRIKIGTQFANTTALSTTSAALYRFDVTSGSATFTVSSAFPVGWWCDVKKVDASANTLTVSGAGCTFDGAASLSTATQYKSWRLFHAGSGVYDLV